MTNVKCAIRGVRSQNVRGVTSCGTLAVLHPTPTFPIRTQDAIVCGQACWLELTDSTVDKRGGRTLLRNKSSTTRQFLPRTHSTPNTTHSFPLGDIPTARDGPGTAASDKRGRRRRPPPPPPQQPLPISHAPRRGHGNTRHDQRRHQRNSECGREAPNGSVHLHSKKPKTIGQKEET